MSCACYKILRRLRGKMRVSKSKNQYNHTYQLRTKMKHISEYIEGNAVAQQLTLDWDADRRAMTEVRPPKPTGRWKYKISIYSLDRVAETLALMRYLALPIHTEKPLIKNAIDRLTQRSATFMYWVGHPQPFITLLDAEGRAGHNVDAYLVSYDWETKRTERLQEIHWHRSR